MNMEPTEQAPEWLNYHHLRHFWMIAQHRSITRAARVLNISQSTLSEQLKELEEWLGQPLFDRRGRQLHLTDAGRIALEHAETIFAAGRELLTRFRQSAGRGVRRVLRLGAVGPLSKNLQFDFIQPLLADRQTRIVVVAGALEELARQLREHQLDVVLSNIPLRADQEENVFNHVLGEVPVYLVGARSLPGRQRFPQCVVGQPLFLPSYQSHVRADFELLLSQAGIEPDIHAEVDDMALLRLLALSGQGLALVSKIVMERELLSPRLKFMLPVPGLVEKYFALTVRTKFESTWVTEIIGDFRLRLKELASRASG